MRPIRITLSVAVSKYFDNGVNLIQRKTKFSRRVSIGILVFLANICGTCALMSLGIFLAAAFSGVPVFPLKV